MQSTTFITIWEPVKSGSQLAQIELEKLQPSERAWPVQVMLTWKDGTTDHVLTALSDEPETASLINNQNQSWQGRIGFIRLQRNTIKVQKWIQAFKQ